MRVMLTMLGAACAIWSCQSSWPASERTQVPAPCCEDRGTCLASTFVEPRYGKLLSHTGCSETTVCVPTELQGLRKLPTCQTASTHSEGRCMADCLPDLQRQEGLARDNCTEGHLCVPCYDPLTGSVTGACAVGDDTGPEEPPRVFGACCDGIGRCVPEGLLASFTQEQRDALGRDSCETEGELCVPRSALEQGDDFVPVGCTSSVFEQEGRCLPACLAALSQAANSLRQDSCGRGEVCAPCYDPLTGESTGSCSLGKDPGPQAPPLRLQSCCGELGKCLPARELPSEVVGQLAQAECGESDAVCAPMEFLQPGFVAETCVVEGFGSEGRCLPACLPALADQAMLLAQSGCAAQHVCAPCYNPLTNVATGVCAFAGDPGPTEPFSASQACCSGLGLCLPDAAVPADARAQLGSDDCTGAQLCVPRSLVEHPDDAPASCTMGATGAEGRCLPDCLPAVLSQAALLARDDCPVNHACAPCFDPTSGAATGVCSTGTDRPARPPELLAQCCAGLGRCTPSAWVPEAFTSLLGADSCDADRLCVAPQALLRGATDFVPPSCVEPATGAEGRCLPACLPPVASRAAALSGAGCEPGNLCVPCFDPIGGEASGACTFGADPGPQQPPVIFEPCCGNTGEGLGLCVPKSLAPPMAAAALPVDSCAPEHVCAPRALLQDQSTPLTSCVSVLATSGVCLSSCFLPALTPAGTCTGGQACAPCDQLGAGVGGC